MKPFRLILLFAILPLFSFAQIDTSALNVSGYVDVFYSRDFGKNYSGPKQSFLTSFNLANQFALNHALVQVEYEKGITTFHAGFQAGSFTNFNYPEGYRFLNEAYIDVRLNKSESLTFSAGIFPSHLGFESAISIDNIVLSQSLASENSPYYLVGTRLDFKPNTKWGLGVVLCNGWQEIEFVSGPINPSIGTYISFNPTKAWQFYWATYYGNITGFNVIDIGYFNNFYIQYEKNRFRLITGYDYGIINRDNSYDQEWSITSMLFGFDISKKVSIGIRGEYLIENNNNITASPLSYITETGIFGASFNMDFDINETLKFRIENRFFNANYDFFPKDQSLVRNNNNITASISARF